VSDPKTIYRDRDEAHEVIETITRGGRQRILKFSIGYWGWGSTEIVRSPDGKFETTVRSFDTPSSIETAYKTKRTPWHEMRDERDAALATIEEHVKAAQHLRAYLQSEKFRCGDRLDGYVNVVDVLHALEGIR
jgi:hypothetical protein